MIGRYCRQIRLIYHGSYGLTQLLRVLVCGFSGLAQFIVYNRIRFPTVCHNIVCYRIGLNSLATCSNQI